MMEKYKTNYPDEVLDQISFLMDSVIWDFPPHKNIEFSFNDKEKSQVYIEIGYDTTSEYDEEYFVTLISEAYHIEPLLKDLFSLYEKDARFFLIEFFYSFYDCTVNDGI